MKRKNKLLVVLALSACLWFGLTACDSAKTNDPNSATPNDTKVETQEAKDTSAETGAPIDGTHVAETDVGVDTNKEPDSEKVEETTAPHAHTEIVDPAIAPTCTEKGKSEGKHCSVCNEVLVAQNEVAALGHTEVIDAAVAPTCTEKGKTEGKHCSVCNEVLVAQNEVVALGHTEVIDAAVAPTCTEKGKTEGKHCSVCNEILVAQKDMPANGHSFVKGKCSWCNAEDPDYSPYLLLKDFVLRYGTKNSSGEYFVKKDIASDNIEMTARIFLYTDGRIVFDLSSMQTSGLNTISMLLSMEYNADSTTQSVSGYFTMLQNLQIVDADISGYFYKDTFSANNRYLYGFTCTESNLTSSAKSLYESLTSGTLTLVSQIISERNPGFTIKDLGYPNY